MSLINQRRPELGAAAQPQFTASHRASLSAANSASVRWFGTVLRSITFGVLVWFGLTVLPAWAARGAGDVSLLDFGIVEGIGSVRLLLEFDRLPDYRVRSGKQKTTALIIQFFGTDKAGRLKIPAFHGPLLKTVELSSVKPDLQLSLGVAEPVKLQAYALPADTVHGVRLLLDFSVEQDSQPLVLDGVPVTTATNLRRQNEPVASRAADSSEQAEILLRKALRYLEQGDNGAARIQFAKALDLTPGNVELRLRLVDLLAEQQQLERAEKLLIGGLTLAPESSQLRTYYGRFLLDKNQLARALKLMLSKPIPALPDQPDYHALLAALEQENGQFANAATRYRELLKIRPAQADWWLMLAIAYEQLNDLKRARSAYRQALEKTGLSAEHRQFSMERLAWIQGLSD